MNPKVSIFTFCRNAVDTIQASVESVLSQDHDNIEVIVQDGASTDGTLEILHRFGDRIDLVSEPDSGHSEAFWKALNRCTGDILGSCLADEQLLPDAIASTARVFESEPDIGAVAGLGLISDLQTGKTELHIGSNRPFDFTSLLFRTYNPFFSSAVFSRSALENVGLGDGNWNILGLEFELWCRLATDYRIRFLPKPLSVNADHESQLTKQPKQILQDLEARIEILGRLFSETGFFADQKKLHLLVLRSQCRHCLIWLEMTSQDKERSDYLEVKDRITELIQGLEDACPQHAVEIREEEQTIPSSRDNDGLTVKLIRIFSLAPRSLIFLLPSSVNRAIRRSFLFFGLDARDVYRKWIERYAPLSPSDEELWLRRERRACHETARVYAARGQIEDAYKLWKRAAKLEDKAIDSEACRMLLLSPEATNHLIYEAQLRWAKVHASNTGKRYRPKWVMRSLGMRKVRIGCHCSNWNADYVKLHILPAIGRLDRSRFALFGFSPNDESDHTKGLFDSFHNLGGMDDSRFVEEIRRMNLDIWIELSGFYPGHRFSAMAARMAPLQISHGGHLATSGVENVDYVIADPISAPVDGGQYFTETVWRLPGCFLCFDMDAVAKPGMSDSKPGTGPGPITFGCFSDGCHMNTSLIETWARILAQVPGSRLVLGNRELRGIDNRRFLLARFERFGISRHRIEICDDSVEQIDRRPYSEIHVGLDPFPHCDSLNLGLFLAHGVPVVSLAGQTFASRGGASVLHFSGCSDLVADSLEGYVSTAVKLCSEKERLGSCRRGLRRMCLDHGFADVSAYAAHLEEAFMGMLREVGR